MIKKGSERKFSGGAPVSSAAGPAIVTVYAAERLPGPDGMVEREDTPLSDAEAVSRLQGKQDVVVCGGERRANRHKARELTIDAFGGFEEDKAHQGRMALPHVHAPDRTPDGIHAFFEAPPRHARKKKE
jgi:hypothetical protein